MLVFVNGLSLGSLSGRHVLFGHLDELARRTEGEHEFLLLHRPGTDVSSLESRANIAFEEAPSMVERWPARVAWEATRLPARIRGAGASLYFTPSGTSLPRCPVPQVVLCPNPWCLVRDLERTPGEALKAAIQRVVYRRTYRSAAMMAYISAHLRGLYRDNAGGREENAHVIAYLGLNRDTVDLASQGARPLERRGGGILAVSVMARWKGVESLLVAATLLRDRGVDVPIDLVGGWPDGAYRQRVESDLRTRDLQDRVRIHGRVPRDALHEFYADARVYCLMSRCESFGIPAVEAQAFGTPVVGSDVCAMAEIGGEGGRYLDPGDHVGIADELGRLLTDRPFWETMSSRALENAARYRWETCSTPLLKMFDLAPIRLSGSPTLGARRS